MNLLLFFQVMLGYAKYQCGCVRYQSDDYIAIIITAAVTFLIIIIALAILIRVYRGTEIKPQGPEHNDVSGVYTRSSPYSRRLPDYDTRSSPYNRNLPNYDTLNTLYSRNPSDYHTISLYMYRPLGRSFQHLRANYLHPLHS